MEKPDAGLGRFENTGDSPLYVNTKQFHRILKRRVTRQKARDATAHAAYTQDAQDDRSQGTSSCASPEGESSHAWEEIQKGNDTLYVESHSIKTSKQPVADEVHGPLRVSQDSNSSDWPYNCKYFVSELMDAEGAISLLKGDAEFYPADSNDPESFMVVDLTETGSHSFVLSPSDSQFDQQLRMCDLAKGSTRILFISQKRLYAIQLIHENNGCWGAHTSFCSDVGNKSCRITIPDDLIGDTPCAYHIWVKPRPWWNEEHFVYARHDFHSRRKFVLVVGTSLEAQRQRLLSQFQFRCATQPHLFSTLLALVTTWTKDLEEFVWEQDFNTQRLESDTGWSTVGHTQLKPLPREKLALRKDMIFTKDALSHAARASESFDELFNFLSTEVRAIPSAGYNANLRPNQLEDAFLQQGSKQWHQRRQAQCLIDRLDTQWNIVSALMAQHNNSLNYQIATDSRVDTIVMRRISFVTIAFLPATFLATFFSMSFFHVTSNDIVVSPAIWIYVVCVIPLTFGLAWQSSTRGLSAVKWIALRLRRKNPRKSVYFEDRGKETEAAPKAQQMA